MKVQNAEVDDIISKNELLTGCDLNTKEIITIRARGQWMNWCQNAIWARRINFKSKGSLAISGYE